MEIVKNFGLDPIIFGAQIINFLIVFYLLKRFLYKPVLDLLKKREDSIKEGLQKAEEGRLLYEETVKKEKEILKKAKDSARQTMNEAKNEAAQLANKMEENSKLQAEKIIAAAREQIELETKEAEKRLAAKVSKLSVEFLQTALKGMFSEKDQKEVLEKAIKQIEKPN